VVLAVISYLGHAKPFYDDDADDADDDDEIDDELIIAEWSHISCVGRMHAIPICCCR